ncbi:hypothetical protein FNV43_RR02561 [Rhamnella rubrinervis]|uniref:BOS complex subunit TMEM147 n=1 Tax=Rhamnella rubrinervis TaxID=2594499 RepID=A0A8K0HSE9_9ROSA|nr:hypothetical protein FNV43_RR02561 [Rhamnella rubrinervis]
MVMISCIGAFSFYVQVLEGVIKYRWNALPIEQRDGMKNYISDVIVQLSSNEASFRMERLYVNKLNIILVQNVLFWVLMVMIGLQDDKARWQGFIPDLVSAAETSETICENCMAILKLLSEEVFDFSRGEMTQQKIKELKQSLNRRCGPLLSQNHKFQVVGLGWAFADSVLHRLAPLWVGARGLEFTWDYILQDLEANANLVLSISLAALGSLMCLGKNKPKTLIPIIYAWAGIVATMPSITSYLRRGLGWHFPKVVGFELFTSLCNLYGYWCFFLVDQTASLAGMGVEAYALFFRTRYLAENALQKFQGVGDADQRVEESVQGVQIHQLYRPCNWDHGRTEAPENLSKKLELEKLLLEKLKVYESAVGDSRVKSVLRIKAFPPAFQAIPCNPIVPNLAYNLIDFPSLENRMKKRQKGFH